MERVGAVLGDLGGGENLRRRLAQARAFEQWPELVGTHLAERTRPLRVADERLVILAPGAALRQELTFHTRTILRKFNEAAGGRVAREVVFLESDSLAYEGEAKVNFFEGNYTEYEEDRKQRLGDEPPKRVKYTRLK